MSCGYWFCFLAVSHGLHRLLVGFFKYKITISIEMVEPRSSSILPSSHSTEDIKKPDFDVLRTFGRKYSHVYFY